MARRLSLIALVALISHAWSVDDGFVFDDRRAIELSAPVTGPFSLGTILRNDFWGEAPAHTHAGTWRPLPVVTFWLDFHWGGGRPFAFHLSNVLFHLLACIALALALERNLPIPQIGWAAAIFAVMAAGSEAVASIVGRADVLAAAFCFLAWYLLAGRAKVPAALAFFAALLCKESAFVFPIAIALIDTLGHAMGWSHLRRRDWVLRYGTLAAAACAYFVLRGLFYAPFDVVARSWNNNPLIGEPLPVRLWTGMRLTLLAVRVLLVPLNLSCDYSFAEILPVRSAIDPEALAGALLLLGGIALAVTRFRRAPGLAVAAALFFVPWLIVSNMFALLPTIFAERLLYLPGAGVAVALFCAFQILMGIGTAASEATRLAPRASPILMMRQRGWAFVIAGLWGAGNLALDLHADRTWHDPLSLFGNAIEVSPRCARAWENYGVALMHAGQPAQAVTALERSATIAPKWAQPFADLGVALDQAGRAEAAEQALRHALTIDPDSVEGVHNLVVFLMRHERRSEAAALLESHIERHPENQMARRMLEAIKARESPAK